MPVKWVEGVGKVKDETINIAIAEWCGIPVNICKCGDEKESHSLGRNEHNFVPMADQEEIPSYTTDLNAMHEAEGRLLKHSQEQPTDIEWRMYSVELEKRAGVCLVFHATARQRAEALLRTIGKCKE